MKKTFFNSHPLKIKILRYLKIEWNFLNQVKEIHQNPFEKAYLMGKH